MATVPLLCYTDVQPVSAQAKHTTLSNVSKILHLVRRIESFPDKRTYPNNKYLPRLSSAVERAIRGSSFNPLVCSYGRQIDPL